MKGILFKPDMIQATVERRKTNTRRVEARLKGINQDPNAWAFLSVNKDSEFIFGKIGTSEIKLVKPRYQVGETVYIKEAFMIEQSEGFDEPTDRPFKNDYEWGLLIPHYKLTDPEPELYDDEDRLVKWRSPMMMPEWAARYFILIKDVRAERLQEITEEDANKEGNPYPDMGGKGSLPPLWWYRDVWNSINKDYPWESNPFVFRYEFELKEREKI